MPPIQFVDLKKQYAPYKEEILSGVSRILDGMQLFLGENVRALESEFSSFCGSKHGIGVSDGTAALQIILRAMDIGPGDEVITVSHTFIATIEAILLTGAKPVFVDINPDTFLMDVDQVEAKITSKTKAILPVHLYGQMVDMAPLLGDCPPLSPDGRRRLRAGAWRKLSWPPGGQHWRRLGFFILLLQKSWCLR